MLLAREDDREQPAAKTSTSDRPVGSGIGQSA